MINFNDFTKENIIGHNPDWPQILDHPYRKLITKGYGSEKTNQTKNQIKLN